MFFNDNFLSADGVICNLLTIVNSRVTEAL